MKTVTGWTFVDDENLNEGELALPGVSAEQQLDFDTVVSMLPTRISAEVEGEADKVPVDIIGWSCPQYKQDGGSWPLTGEYTFTAAIPSNYSCEPPPTVQVIMESVSLLANSPVRWNGDSDRIASDLTGGGGGVIVINGSNSTSDGATLIINEDNITVTSQGNPVSGINIIIEVESLTIKDLDLTSVHNRNAITFNNQKSSASILKTEGSCSIAATQTGNVISVIKSSNDLTLDVGDASLTLTNSQRGSSGSSRDVEVSGKLTVNIENGGELTARCPIIPESVNARALQATS